MSSGAGQDRYHRRRAVLRFADRQGRLRRHTQGSLPGLHAGGAGGRLRDGACGFALSVVDEAEAGRVFDALRELDLLEELQEVRT